jgi:tetratricopeptide (TPR) repeat protein
VSARVFALSFSLTFALAFCACKPKPTSTEPDDATSDESSAQEPVKVVQAEDPPELEAAYNHYLAGEYAKIVEELEPALAKWTGPERQRTRAIAQAWIGLAHANSLPENAQEFVEKADSDARALDDREARQLANISRAAYLMGIADHELAEKTLARTIDLDKKYVVLAKVLLGNCLINRAFSDDRLTDKSKLDAAKQVFEEVGAQDNAALRGRAHEGLSVIADLNGDKTELCNQAKAALSDFAAVGASEKLVEGPQSLIEKGSCDK